MTSDRWHRDTVGRVANKVRPGLPLHPRQQLSLKYNELRLWIQNSYLLEEPSWWTARVAVCLLSSFKSASGVLVLSPIWFCFEFRIWGTPCPSSCRLKFHSYLRFASLAPMPHIPPQATVCGAAWYIFVLFDFNNNKRACFSFAIFIQVCCRLYDSCVITHFCMFTYFHATSDVMCFGS